MLKGFFVLVIGLLIGLMVGRWLGRTVCVPTVSAAGVVVTPERYYPPKYVPGTRGLYVDFMN